MYGISRGFPEVGSALRGMLSLLLCVGTVGMFLCSHVLLKYLRAAALLCLRECVQREEAALDVPYHRSRFGGVCGPYGHRVVADLPPVIDPLTLIIRPGRPMAGDAAVARRPARKLPILLCCACAPWAAEK